MSVFVDTGVFYAHHDTDASRHSTARTALHSVLQNGEYGQVTTSEYVYRESKASASGLDPEGEADT